MLTICEGKLATGRATILNGFSVLGTLSTVISQPDGDVFKQNSGFRQTIERRLTNCYYSYIVPRVFGCDRPLVTDTREWLRRELELFDALGNMEITMQPLSFVVPWDAAEHVVDPPDAHFRSRSPAWNLSRREFSALEAYTRHTHGATHRHYGVQIINVFRVEREGETRA